MGISIQMLQTLTEVWSMSVPMLKHSAKKQSPTATFQLIDKHILLLQTTELCYSMHWNEVLPHLTFQKKQHISFSHFETILPRIKPKFKFLDMSCLQDWLTVTTISYSLFQYNNIVQISSVVSACSWQKKTDACQPPILGDPTPI